MSEDFLENFGQEQNKDAENGAENSFLKFLSFLSLPKRISFVCGIILVAVGAVPLVKSFVADEPTVEIIQASPLPVSVETSNEILVDVSGAVVNPGVYPLQNADRIQAALIAAGGLSANADREYVAKNLNLAAKLSDGAKIYIPFTGEHSSNSSNNSNLSNSSNTVSGLINLNSASSSQLDTLPGIGPATATKIINARPYQTMDELLTKKVVSQKVFDQIKDKVSVY